MVSRGITVQDTALKNILQASALTQSLVLAHMHTHAHEHTCPGTVNTFIHHRDDKVLQARRVPRTHMCTLTHLLI